MEIGHERITIESTLELYLASIVKAGYNKTYRLHDDALQLELMLNRKIGVCPECTIQMDEEGVLDCIPFEVVDLAETTPARLVIAQHAAQLHHAETNETLSPTFTIRTTEDIQLLYSSLNDTLCADELSEGALEDNSVELFNLLLELHLFNVEYVGDPDDISVI